MLTAPASHARPERPPQRASRAAARLAALVLLAFLMTACGPLAVGGGARYDYEEGATYPVPAGEAAVIELESSLSAAGVSRSELRRRNPNWIPSGFRGDTANAVTWVSLDVRSAPEDWRFAMSQARVVRSRELGDRGEDATYRYSLQVQLRATPPESARGLTRRLSGDLVVRDGERLPVTFLIEAR